MPYGTGDYSQPDPTNPAFRKWQTENDVVKGWLINSMDPSLISNFIHFPTAKQVWDSLATTFFDGTDASQVYDLKRRVSRVKQDKGSIETYYNIFQDGLDDRLDKVRSDVLQMQPFPTIEQAYGYVRREDIRQSVMLTGTKTSTAAVMASKSVKTGQQLPKLQMEK
ncbi:uncharacterized protein LOC107261597 [Ricinus communis]|uniref:uncharacterized protein LOC107261597 n=1 Tax=Ricinus communis TaxID=3988 RepID=UPI0007727923|nr:uncharacterized protein LOC107261597 [Ricinus communis]|eukprot:XP_015577393.1 uncharacterized protein LOC107261597 [Ricinus communis]